MILVSEEEIENESSTPTYAITTKKLFSPDNDLLYSPPNFFYSSLRWRSPTPQRYIQFSDILIIKCTETSRIAVILDPLSMLMISTSVLHVSIMSMTSTTHYHS